MDQELRNRAYTMVFEEGKGFPDVAQELQVEIDVVARAYAEEFRSRHTLRRRIIIPNYYVVGATWWEDNSNGPYEDKFPEFIKNGYWKMGWDEVSAPPHFAERLRSIRRGDYIAIKRLLGRESAEIRIKAVGKVTGKADDIVIVDWICCPENRLVPIRGCIGTIFGPFHKDGPDKEWLEKVFCL